jgi:hypothetical protein
MAFIGLLWRLVRARWTRRILFWLIGRVVRWFGWRRSLRMLFKGSRWRRVALGMWRVATWLLRASRFTLGLLAGRGHRRRQRLDRGRSPNMRSWGPRLARRRDKVRRSLLAAAGVDPEWRPASRRNTGTDSLTGRLGHPELLDKISG